MPCIIVQLQARSLRAEFINLKFLISLYAGGKLVEIRGPVVLMNKVLKEHLNRIGDDQKREDCIALVDIIEEESGYKARLCGKIIGFGLYRYVYATGLEGESIVTGFLPGSQHISVYIMPGFADFKKELKVLGKHKSAKCCLYIKKLADIDEKVLRKIIKHSVRVMKKKYTCVAV